MLDKKEDRQRGRMGDVRQLGFSGRASVEEATEWIDAHGARLGAEELDVCEAAGRVLASELEAARAMPLTDCAWADGYAVRAGDTVGAGDYNPLDLALGEWKDELPAGAAAPLVAGERLPRGADAILPFELARANDGVVQVFGAVAEGAGIARVGQQMQAGARLLEKGRVLLPQDLGLLASLGVERVNVARRPRVRILVWAAKSGGEFRGQGFGPDANGPMLRALVERDGGEVVELRVLGQRGEMAAALEVGGSIDLVLVGGRSGTGWDDEAPLVIGEMGELAIHGVALRPGGSAGMGVVGSVPVVLLPGDPLACFCAYEMLAGRLVRRLGGRPPELPYAVVEAEVGRKITSAIGTVDLCRVRLEDGRAEPLGSAESGGVVSAVRADGFVVVPAPLEGYAPGTKVKVYVYGPGGTGLGNGR